MNTPAIRLSGLSKRYSGGQFAVEHVDLEIPSGGTFVLLGSSGCGKTTVLRLIARLLAPSTGTIEIEGTNLDTLGRPALRKLIGHVFQQPSLFPHLTVAENIALPLKLEGIVKRERSARVDALLDSVGLNPSRYRDRFPDELSGGQQQRVGVARALSLSPRILLLDEPFGALDSITRRMMQDEIKRLRKAYGVTIVFVTHDVFEAIDLGDSIAVMNNGCIEQIGTGEEIVATPASDFVRDLITRPVREMQRMAGRLLDPPV